MPSRGIIVSAPNNAYQITDKQIKNLFDGYISDEVINAFVKCVCLTNISIM